MNKRKQGPQHFGDVEKDRKPCVPCVWYGPAFPLAYVPKIVTKQAFYAVNLLRKGYDEKFREALLWRVCQKLRDPP